MKNILNTTETISELEILIKELGHFPKQKELQGLYKNNIIRGINKIGGLNKVQELMGFKVGKLQKYWTEEKCIDELQSIIQETGRFPMHEELKAVGKGGLSKAISKSGGINKYHELLDMSYNLVPIGYWTEDICILELNKIIESIGHFPLQKELIKLNKQDLVGGINKNGGLTTIKEHMGYKIDKVLKGYWTEEKCTEELQKVISDIGHFPSQSELTLLKRTNLTNAIRNNGGSNKFRNILNHEYIKVPKDYWTKEKCIEEIERISNLIGHFPSHEEITTHGVKGIGGSVICRCGGIGYIRDLMGYPPLMISDLCSYYSRHGKKAEYIILEILNEYCKRKNIELPKRNVKLYKQNIIEFVCNIDNDNAKIGIDVTITRRKFDVSRKWIKKDYYKYLDKLWIVVINNKFSKEDYVELNNKSPNNVYIMNIEEFCEELQYDLDESTKNKIEKYKSCNFHNKDRFKKE